MAGAVTIDGHPAGPESRLTKAEALEKQEQHGDALLAYYRAISDAQREGRWLDRATTPVALLDRVNHALRYVVAGRRRLFDIVLEPVYSRHGRAALRRFEACLAIQAGERHDTPPDPRQRPSMLYFPGLAAAPYPERSALPWLTEFEQHTDEIRKELLAVLMREERAERVFVSDEAERLGLAGGAGTPAWNGFYFFRHGERRAENHALCPRTSTAIEALPLVRIRGQAPEVMFSVLAPGTHILPHRGVTNTRLVCHLPLLVPEGCALVVGGERHEWREGRAVVFDDTYEHEAWNRGTRTRVVLIVDVWNPHLTEAERDAVTALAESIGDFNRAASA
jgi:aspartate beta-hydroxylase